MNVYLYPGSLTCGSCGYALHCDRVETTPGAPVVARCISPTCRDRDKDVRVSPKCVNFVHDHSTPTPSGSASK